MSKETVFRRKRFRNWNIFCRFFNLYKLKIDGNFAPQKENAHERNSWMIEPTWMELRNVKKFD